jgi:hypothetical protein
MLKPAEAAMAQPASASKRQDQLNEAQCLACHKPKESDSYVFTMQQLRETPTR